jgi:hypothetical protein
MEAIQMENNIKIPNSNENVIVSLTVKEILSLAGDKFANDHNTITQAKKKIRQQLEQHQQ